MFSVIISNSSVFINIPGPYMSDPARSYTHASNRAHTRTATARKDVFKSVLENPFRIQWSSRIYFHFQRS